MRRFLSILSLGTLMIANVASAQSAADHAAHHPADAAVPAPPSGPRHDCPMMKGGEDGRRSDGMAPSGPNGAPGHMDDCKAMHAPDHGAEMHPPAPEAGSK
ncbi:hypothetical protein K426_22884 [Sphingobium sp. TKS]|nr:hypothetical protein K426_22884 [Sphingobium sp. TKS]